MSTIKLRGTRILINKPVEKESAIELSEKDKEALEKDQIKTWHHLTVWAIGEEVSSVQPGDVIYIHADTRMEKVEAFDGVKFLIREQDIAWIWENTEKNQ